MSPVNGGSTNRSLRALVLFAWVAQAGYAAGPDPLFYAERVAPIFQENCVTCHGEKKHKGGLRLGTFAGLMQGGEDGAVVVPGDSHESELIRRISLPRDDEEAMPGDGKPPLTADEIKVISLWVAAGASESLALAAIPDAPPPRALPVIAPPAAPDYRPHLAQIQALEKALGVQLVPRSQVPTDGLVLRTASSPARCDDAVLAQLAPLADLIVDAELARTKVTDAGLPALTGFKNLRSVDLSRTAVTRVGVLGLGSLPKLEFLNLTSTAVDEADIASLRTSGTLRRIYVYQPNAPAPAVEAGQVAPAPIPPVDAGRGTLPAASAGR